MARLTVLLPPLHRLAAAATFATWLARGDRLDATAPGRTAALRSAFEFLGANIPAAALARSLDAADAAAASWLRCDPCYVMVDAVAVRMLAWGNLGLSPEEGGELARSLRPLFGDAGFPMEAAAAERWYLRCPPAARLPQFADPGDVLGADLLPHFPRGDNERQWRHLLNEAQVVLHNHPVNARRLQRGQLPANSVWFWGAGRLPDWVRTPFTRVASDDAFVVALARLAKIVQRPLDTAEFFRFAAKDDCLLDLAAVRDGLARWCTPIDAALRQRQLSELELRFESGDVVRYRPWHRWRFWRRARSAA